MSSSDDSEDACCNLRKGIEDSVDRGPTAKADTPFMQRMVDQIEARTGGKATSPQSGMGAVMSAKPFGQLADN